MHVPQLHQVSSKSDEKQKSFINSSQFNGCVIRLGSAKVLLRDTLEFGLLCQFSIPRLYFINDYFHPPQG